MFGVLFVIFIIISIFSLIEKKDYIISSSIYIFICVVLVLVATFRDGNSLRDYQYYVFIYNNIRQGYSFLIEPTYRLFAVISPSYLILFFIYASIGVVTKILAIKQLTPLFYFSLLCYLSNYFILHELTQIRVGIASGLILLSIKPLYDKNIKIFSFISIIAMLFHYSAIVILFLWFIKDMTNKKILFSLIPIAYLFCFCGFQIVDFLPIPYIKEKIELYKMAQNAGDENLNVINIFGIIIVLKLVIYYFFLLNYDFFSKKNKYFQILFTIYGFSLFLFPFLSFMPILSYRLRELFGIVEVILLPLIYYRFKPKCFSRLIVVSICLLYFLLSVYKDKLII